MMLGQLIGAFFGTHYLLKAKDILEEKFSSKSY